MNQTTRASSRIHKQIFAIALPMMLSNISVPLLGLVDTAVIGHLPQSYYLAGVAVGSMVITLIFWMMVFLRMSTTGLVAQAVGANNKPHIIRLLLQSIFIALFVAIFILLIQKPLCHIVFSFVHGSQMAIYYAKMYFNIRIWSAPASLINMVLLGWLLGMQNAKIPMLLLIITNTINILLDVLFVVVLKWSVAGVAFASLCADYIAMFCGLYIVYKMALPFYERGSINKLLKQVINLETLKPFIVLNRDIFIRTLCLQIAFAFMTIQGTKLGVSIVSANAVLMNFLLLISFSMDGLAYAAEALVGKSIGERNVNKLKTNVKVTLFWSTIFSIVQFAIFYVWGDDIIAQITSLNSVQIEARRYLPWLILIPLTSMLGFVFDGVFIGMTRAKEMRNSMLFSLCVIYFPVYLFYSGQGNHGLWIAMNAFMLARGLSLLWIYFRLNKSKQLLL